MKNLHRISLLLLLLTSYLSFAQGGGTVKITGKVIEQDTKLPLEFATVAIYSAETVVNGGLTDANGEYSIAVKPGNYSVKIEFISFKPTVIPAREITSDVNLGITSLAPDAEILDAVEVVGERSTVEIKLDKRVYTVGNDMMVRGGTVSDVLDNVPSVSVDAEGNVALRGNESVTILIDGRPSNIMGGNVADVLRQLPADSVDKVEVITNPSARYDAEGGGGIINIILKKGSAGGFNGSIIANTGTPDNHGLNANLNFRSEQFNIFSNIGYQYRNNPGNSFTNTEYLDSETNATTGYINERRRNERLQRGLNASFGLELFITPTITWTNSVNFRRSNGDNPTETWYDNYDADSRFAFSRYRYNLEDEKDNNVNFSSNLIKKFDEKGHELRVQFSASMNNDDENAVINDVIPGSANPNDYSFERTFNLEKETRTMAQADYVLPIGENSRFEAGYRGNFSERLNDAKAEILEDGLWQNNANFTNELEYNEYVNALYTQYGSKHGKFSYLLGLRWEDTNIDINLLNVGEYNSKKYNNFFPSAVLSYEFSESSNVSLSYSRRINRPRGRFINPFSGLESNINIFQGNPDLDPSMTNSIDLGYLKKWRLVTLSTSAYLNATEDSFQFVRRTEYNTDPTDNIVDGTQITYTSPINLAKEFRFGFEFNINYNPYKWWRINSNFNFFRNETQGDYTFTYVNDEGITINDYQNFDVSAYSWSTRINSKITLPGKIDWQLNGTYNAPQNRAQGRNRAVASANTALSKDILKDRATIALNVQDIFNSRKMKYETEIPFRQNSYSEMQWRQRQVNLSFTYRFNMSKTDRQREQQQQRNQQDGGDEFMGG